MIQTQKDYQLRQLRKRIYMHNANQKNKFNQIFAETKEPNWKSPIYQEIIQNGIPTNFREIIWKKFALNYHGITQHYYHLLLQQSNIMRKSEPLSPRLSCSHEQLDRIGDEKFFQQQRSKKIRWLVMIEQDITRTFAQLKLFTAESQQTNTLRNILAAWCMYRDDIGYIQGNGRLMQVRLYWCRNVANCWLHSPIGGKLMQVLNQIFSCFELFCTMMTSDVLYSLYTWRQTETTRIISNYNNRLRLTDNQLYNYMQQNGVRTSQYLLNWIMCLFTRCINIQMVGIVWDILLIGNLQQRVFIQMAISVVLCLREKIIQANPEIIYTVLRKGIELEQYELFMNVISNRKYR